MKEQKCLVRCSDTRGRSLISICAAAYLDKFDLRHQPHVLEPQSRGSLAVIVRFEKTSLKTVFPDRSSTDGRSRAFDGLLQCTAVGGYNLLGSFNRSATVSQERLKSRVKDYLGSSVTNLNISGSVSRTTDLACHVAVWKRCDLEAEYASSAAPRHPLDGYTTKLSILPV
jgi:hypothetical protein